ncbi:hypothetical protein ILUMI_05972 [Ignelater luminosus]|uniref:Acyltransferase 3 domain-containing protein n=1 Tax=Ignelater luminosus TaxID=2038154 RepID=A0A8K0DGL7_IGNLU|nr:hypothetical protein ILUMI_05972 [Ignelater luminosus]
MMWIILAHKYALTLILPIKNYLNSFEFIGEPANMFIMNAYVSVDTFFLLGGVVLAYTFLIASENGVRFNVIFYYIHRYLRLTPLIAVIVGIYLTILKHFGSGPIWPNTIDFHLITSCEQNWWRTLLYIQNFGLIVEEICIGQTWYLGVDFQLFLISPLLLLPLKKWPKVTLIMIGFLSVCSSTAAFLTSFFLELGGNPSSQTDLEKSEAYIKYYYFATWIRCLPWLIGIIVGYGIFKIRRTQKELFINKIILLVLWVASLAVLYVCVFEGYDVAIGKADKVANAFHMALTRPAWAIALSWVIFACTTGYGGPINWFLTLPVFQVISKLTYSMYLTHYSVLLVIGAQMVAPPAFSNFQMLYGFWSDFMCTLGVSIVFSLAFESPIIAIEKYFYRKI